MGRAKSDGARGKARPSSSSSAAGLSQASLSAGFGGYVGSTRVEAAGPSEEAFLSIDGETAANLRRLSKKDPITKIKALGALTTYFQEHSAAEVSSVLSSWAFEYKKLVMDNNRQTREATHKAMCSLANTVGRALAPQLRSLMGPWWMSHFDPFNEVCDAAKQALQAAFPGQKKRLEALAFCAADILAYIDENLKLTPQTISDKGTPADESAEKHERVISSTLLSLSGLLTILFDPDGESLTSEELISACVNLFRDHKMFQAPAKSGKSRTRSAVYQTLQVYIRYVPSVISDENIEATAKFILGTFQEKESNCHRSMWDLILVFSQRYPNAWESNSIRKVVLQRFWAFLRHGCYGSQQDSYPCLLPMLAVIPPAALSPAKGFFVEFFTNLWKGCEESSWTQEQGMLLLETTKECFIWMISHENRLSNAEDSSLQSFLIENVLFGILWDAYIGTKIQKTSSLLQSDQFNDRMGSCIVNIANVLDDESIDTFWICLRKACSTLLLADDLHVNDRMLRFLLKFDSLLGDEKRSLFFNKVVKPFVADGFVYIKNSEKPQATKLFSGLVSTYGLHVFDLLASQYWKGGHSSNPDEATVVAEVFSSKHLQYLFRNELLPWSISGDSDELKIYVLLTFLEDDLFSREWDHVLTTYFSDSQDSTRMNTFALLIKTLQSRCNEPSKLEKWKSPKIDETVLKNMTSFQQSSLELTRITLKGTVFEGSYFSILSISTVASIVEELAKNLASAIYKSPNEASISVARSIVPSAETSEDSLQRANSSIDTLLLCWDSLRYADSDLVSKVLGALFCLHWTYLPPVSKGGDDDDENEDLIKLYHRDDPQEHELSRCLLQAREQILASCVEFSGIRNLRRNLIEGIKKMLSEAEAESGCKSAAYWILDLMQLTCRNPQDRQESLSFLLSATDYWPVWSVEARNGLVDLKKHFRIASAVVEMIHSSLDPEVLFLGEGIESRPWLIIELLCTSNLHGESGIWKFLQACAKNNDAGSEQRTLLDSVLDSLFAKAADGDPYLSALLGVLRSLTGQKGSFGRSECETIFATYLSSSTPSTFLPYVLEVIMPSLIKRRSGDVLFPSEVEPKICSWLEFALQASNLSDIMQWIQVAVACFPLESTGGVTALLSAAKADISERRRNLLLQLLRKQSIIFSNEVSDPALYVLIARLIAPAVAYCWKSFNLEDWIFILSQLRKWIEDAVVNSEELTESVAASVDSSQAVNKNSNDVLLLGTAVTVLSLVQGFKSLDDEAESSSSKSLDEADWLKFESRAVDNVFRIFLAAGLAEALASSNEALRQQVSIERSHHSHLWDRIAEIVLSAPVRVRESAVRAVDLWGLGKSGISALYSLLFSPNPIASLQWAAYKLLSTDPLQHQSVTWKPVSSTSSGDDQDQDALDMQDDTSFDFIRPELLAVLATPSSKLLGSSSSLGHYFLAWSLFLTHQQCLSTTSQAKDRLLQYAKDSDTPRVLLDCLFRYIPTKRSFKKEDLQLSPAVEAVKRSAGTASVSFAVEALLWGGGGANDFAVLAGAIYGLILRVLPAVVQTWFAGLREKGAVSAIEAFTADYCSPRLLSEEFNQVQAAAIADENLIFKANRSLREVTVIYKKEEAAMEMAIKLPSCYPLKAVEVDCSKRLGISETRMRKWILSMASFLRNQNGSLSEALLIWKRNVDREFEGVEECPICYSIIHTSNHSLPRLTCKTCRHKFHGACLYKWFSTSHKSTCPLCQTPF